MRSFLVMFAAAIRLSAAEKYPPSFQLSLVSPLDYQVVQRESVTNGYLTIAGLIHSESKTASFADAIETKLSGESVSGPLSGEWKSLPCDSRAAAFRGRLSVPAGGWYRLELRALRNGVVIAAALIEHVGIGEVFVIAGQSNSANYGEERQQPKTGLVSAFGVERWQVAADPQLGAGGTGGSFMPAFGDLIVQRLHVPVGIVANGVGSTSVREWLPAGSRMSRLPTLTENVITVGLGEWECNGTIFDAFTARLKQLGPRGFRAVLWHQGESDANQKDPERTLPGDNYRQDLARLIRESQKVIGWDVPWFVAQVSSHGSETDRSPDIRAAQKTLWESGVAFEGPDTDALTGEMRERNGQGVHFSAKGLREHARLWAAKVIPWLEAQLGQAHWKN